MRSCNCHLSTKHLVQFLERHGKQMLDMIDRLLTRIQGWSPGEVQGSAGPTAASQHMAGGAPGPADSEEAVASKWGLARNPDGGWTDLESGRLFEDLAFGIACKSFAKTRGIPLEDAVTIFTGGSL